MNATLRLERSYVDLILDHSKGPRHADRAHISGAICSEIVKRSWKIMNRLLEYLKRGFSHSPCRRVSFRPSVKVYIAS